MIFTVLEQNNCSKTAEGRCFCFLTKCTVSNQILLLFYCTPVLTFAARALWRSRRLKKLYHYVRPGVVVLPLMLSLDESTVDGNGRKSLIPVWLSFLNLRAHVRHKAWARQLIGYLPKFNKARWPKGISDASKRELKRLVRAVALRKMLEPIVLLGQTGVKIELPGGTGCRPQGRSRVFSRDREGTPGLLFVRFSILLRRARFRALGVPCSGQIF